jgi:formate--tetrahydrofolate ligase
VIATKTALKLADYVVTEAGFGADLGAEKFIDIKCRKSGLRPSLVVLVATIRALKFHGGAELKELTKENPVRAGERECTNLERHVNNEPQPLRPAVLWSPSTTSRPDTDAEIALLRKKSPHHDAPVVVARHWAERLAPAPRSSRDGSRSDREVPSDFRFVYEDADSLWDKMTKVATKIYGASEVAADSKVRAQIKKLQADGYGHYPVCVAKTPVFVLRPIRRLRGAPSGHVVNIREVRLAAGAEFIVMICGDVMTMPGLPKEPSAARIDIDASGKVVGLF